MKKGLAILLALVIAFTYAPILGDGNVYAAGSSSKTAEYLALDTWTADSITNGSSDWFKFKTKKGGDWRYFIYTEVVPNSTKEDHAYQVKVTLPEVSTTKDVDDCMLKLTADKYYRIKVKGKAFIDTSEETDEEGSGSGPASIPIKSAYTYRIIVVAVPCEGIGIAEVPTDINDPKPIQINNVYVDSTDSISWDTNTHYYSFKTSSRTGSKYLLVLRDVAEKKVAYWTDIDANGKLEFGKGEVNRWTGFRETHQYDMPALVKKPGTTQEIMISAIDLNGEEDVAPGDGSFIFKVMELPKLPLKPSITVTKGTKKFTVKYKGVENATKYKIAYKTSTATTWKTVVTTNKSKTIKQLKSGKTYQVKVRALRTVNGKDHAGRWSAVKSIKVY